MLKVHLANMEYGFINKVNEIGSTNKPAISVAINKRSLQFWYHEHIILNRQK